MPDTKISAATNTTTPLLADSLPLARVADNTARRLTVGNLRGSIINVKDYGAAGDGVTDDSAALVEAIAAAVAQGGGVVFFPAGNYKILSQIALPNTPTGAGLAQKQKPITWQGVGGHFDGQDTQPMSLAGGTRVSLQYQGTGSPNDAKIVTYGVGVFTLRDIVLQDTTAGPSSTPFIFTTNTTLKIEATVAFQGTTKGLACQQDAIILGGTLTGPFDNPNGPYQGYGTTIVGAYFDQVRRVVYGRTYVNQVVIRDCFFNKNCGSNLSGGACIELDGSLNADLSPIAGCVIEGNYFETIYYTYGVKLINCVYNTVSNNGFEDGHTSSNFMACVRLEGSNGNFVRDNFGADRSNTPATISEDSASLNKNNWSSPYLSEGDHFTKPVYLYNSFRVSTPLGANAKMIPSQVIPVTTATTVVFGGENWDTDSIHDNASPQNTKLTCKTPGKYLINLRLTWATAADNGRRIAKIVLNGSTDIVQTETGTNANGQATSQATTLCDLAVNDYIEAQVYHDHGGGLQILSTLSEFSMVRVV